MHVELYYLFNFQTLIYKKYSLCGIIHGHYYVINNYFYE
jgi:hypothetical protein